MRTDLPLAVYFFLIAVIVLLLTPTYLLAIFELEKIYRYRISENWVLRKSFLHNFDAYVKSE